MRMAGPDVVLFIVGALLFGGALTAIIVTQGPGAFTGVAGSPSGLYSVSWPTATAEQKKDVADFTSGSVSADVNGTDIAMVTVRVDCSDSPAGAAAPFAITVNVDGPNGLKGKPTTGNCGDKLEIPVHVQDAPPATSVSGSTPEAAQASLPPNPNATAGVGAWKVTFSGARSTPAGGLPALPAPGPSGDIAFAVETYTPKLDPIVK